MKKKKNINKSETQWLEPKDWSFRDNKARKHGAEDKGTHPSIAVGKNGKKIANVGITHNAKRGHHKNAPLSRNPDAQDNRNAYVRDDLQYDDERYLKVILKNFRKLPKQDEETVIKIINKKR